VGKGTRHFKPLEDYRFFHHGSAGLKRRNNERKHQIQNHSNTNINLNFRKQHQRKLKKSSTKSTLKKQQVLMVNQLK
jgi:hypothetical protein